VTPTPGRTGVSAQFYWFLASLLLLPVWIPTYFVTEDGLAHAYWIEVYRALGEPDHPFHQHFARHLSWDTPHHLLHFGLQYGLASLLQPHLAQKLVASLVILSWAGAVHFLSRRFCGEISLGALAALLLVHSSWLYNGYFAFLGAMSLALLALGVLATLGSPRWNTAAWRPYAALAVLGVTAYYAHFFVAALILLVSASWLAFPWRPLRFSRAGLALAMLPTAGLVVWYLGFGTFGSGGWRWESVLRATARFVGLAFFRGFAAPDPLFWMALATLALVLATLCWTAVGAARRREISPERRFVLLFALVLAAAFFVAPVAVGDALNFNSRLQYAMWAWLLPTLPFGLDRRTRRVLLVAIVALLAWQLVTFSLRGMRFSREYALVVQQAQAIPAGATVKSEVKYDSTRYERSWMHVLAAIPEDIALRREAPLLSSYFVKFPLYWVVPRPGVGAAPEYLIDLGRDADGKLQLIVRSAAVPHQRRLRHTARHPGSRAVGAHSGERTGNRETFRSDRRGIPGYRPARTAHRKPERPRS
jgi:hypothetical protein